MDWQELIGIALGAILINNFIFSQFLGICPFMGVSKSTETAVGMGLAVTFAAAITGPLDWQLVLRFYLLFTLYSSILTITAFLAHLHSELPHQLSGCPAGLCHVPDRKYLLPVRL